jgi:phosphoglycerol transferase MdoB-like AlkP superfamily enzyme
MACLGLSLAMSLGTWLALVLLAWVAERWLPLTLLRMTKRPLAANVLHASVLLIGFGVMLTITARPGLSAAIVLAIVSLLVLVNRDKYRTLREPFLACDFVYFWDAIRHPKLYLPYFGYGKAAMLATGFVVLLWGWWALEPTLGRQTPGETLITLSHIGLYIGHYIGGLLVLFGAGISLWMARRLSAKLSLAPIGDMQRLGLVAMLAAYQCKAWQTRQDPETVLQAGPFAKRQTNTRRAGQLPESARACEPILLCLQLESFADFRRIYSSHGHRAVSQAGSVLLPAWDGICSQAWARGALQVPAFGANTVRSEFEFLFGMPVTDLGVHGFEPYQWMAHHARGRKGSGLLSSLPATLKNQGFKTVFVHPYDHAFYQRDRVLPMVGFDDLVDDQAFRAQWAGRAAEGLTDNLTDGIHRYISDAALGKALIERLQAQPNEQALFVHAITMQGHGPYVRGRGPHSPETLFAGYQACLKKTDQMLDEVWSVLKQLDRPVVLCAFGDHVPILPEVYADWGMPDGTTDYVIWRNWAMDGDTDTKSARELLTALSCHQLGTELLAAAGIEINSKSNTHNNTQNNTAMGSAHD